MLPDSELSEIIKDLLLAASSTAFGIFLSIIAFLFTYRFSWRNRITREFTVSIEENYSLKEQRLKSLSFLLNINCTNPEEIALNFIYFPIPKGVHINSREGQTIGEQLFGTDKYYILRKKEVFQYSCLKEFKIDNEKVIALIESKKIKKIQVFVNSNRYGITKSNKVKIRNNGR